MLDNAAKLQSRGKKWPNLNDKIVLVTGAAGAIGAAIVAGDQGRRRHGDRQRSRRPPRHRSWRSTSPPKPTGSASPPRSRPSTAGSTGWSMPPASPRSAMSRRPISPPGGACSAVNLDGTFLGCKYAFPLLRKHGGVDRQSVVGARADRQRQSRRLYRLEGRRVAAHQIGGAARRALQAAGALQRRVPGLHRRADGGRDRARHARSGRGAQQARARHSARPAGRAGGGRRARASICCRTMPPSSPAPTCRSTAG